MHISDGYLGPATCGVFYAVMAPLWAAASRIVKRTLNARQVPLLGIGAAFSFAIMMFNVPIPGGTTGHATGSVLVAILLGPWAACIAVTVALVVQALLFGDGGITAIGANCFNMAFVEVFAGYYLYRVISTGSSITSGRRVVAAGIAGYVALNVTALSTAVMFGIQPLLYKTAGGQSLYCPYGLNVAIPAMMGEHLLIFGWLEAIVTALVVKYLQKQDSSLLETGGGRAKTMTKLWLGILILALISPLGILLPERFKAGDSWGEWGVDTIKELVGYVPQAFESLSSLWSAPIPDYAFKGWEGKGLPHLSMAYIFSAILGIAVTVLAVTLIGKLLAREGIDLGTRRSRFIERSIMGALSFFKESIFADEYASMRGFLQARDPRVKILTILALLLAVLFSKSIPFIACIYGLSLLLAVVSSIDIPYFLKRTWLFMPLFSLFIAAPALFNLLSPGDTLVNVKVFSFVFNITRQGLASAGIFFLRILTSVSLCVLLSLTTKHYCLLRALRIFYVPQLFVMTLGMCYRYVYSFIELIQNSYIAVKSRVGNVSSSSKGRRIVAWNVASLWRRSYDLHGQVYQAMLSRGYSGEPRSMDDFCITPGDILCVSAAILTLIGGLWQARFLN